MHDNICAFQAERSGSVALDLAGELGPNDIMREHPRRLLARVLADSTCVPQSAMRVASNIAALVTRPDVIVFRAAYAGLDRRTDQRIVTWLKRHAADHVPILSTNRPSHREPATRALFLHAADPSGRSDAADG